MNNWYGDAYIVTPFHFVYMRMRQNQTIEVDISTLSYCAWIKWWAQLDFGFGNIWKISINKINGFETDFHSQTINIVFIW